MGTHYLINSTSLPSSLTKYSTSTAFLGRAIKLYNRSNHADSLCLQSAQYKHACVRFMINQIAAPGDVVSSLSVPSTDSIGFHPLVALGNHQSEEQLKGMPEYGRMPVHNVPFFFQVNHIHSAFVEVRGVAMVTDTIGFSHSCFYTAS